jgi:hypothetical protein
MNTNRHESQGLRENGRQLSGLQFVLNRIHSWFVSPGIAAQSVGFFVAAYVAKPDHPTAQRIEPARMHGVQSMRNRIPAGACDRDHGRVTKKHFPGL